MTLFWSFYVYNSVPTCLFHSIMKYHVVNSNKINIVSISFVYFS